MPLHDYRCRSCDHLEERFVKLAELDTSQFCPHCFSVMQRLMPAPNVQMDIPGYTCPITGKWVDGRRQHEANLRVHGCRVLETGEHEANLRRREREASEMEDRVAESAAREVASWPAEKQARLVEEASRGIDINFERIGTGASNG